MWAVSDRYLETLAHSHDEIAFVEVLHDGVVVATLDSTLIPDPDTGSLVASISGNIQVDRSEVRRSGTVEFLDLAGAVDPTIVDTLFAPLSTEIRPWKGVTYWDASQADKVPLLVEMIPNGNFETDTSGWAPFLGPTLSVDATVFVGGTRSMRVTWATSAALTQEAYAAPVWSGMPVGSVWLTSGWVRVPTGSTRVVMNANDGAGYSISSTSDPVPADNAWHQVTMRFVVQANGLINFGFVNLDAATAGQYCNIDGVSVVRIDINYGQAVETEYVPLATLVVTDMAGAYPNMSISGYDRMWLVGPFIGSFAIPPGTLNTDAIKNILATQIPPNRLDVSGILTTEHSTGGILYNEQDSATTAIHDLAAASGQVLYCDPMGVFTTEAEATFADQPVMVYEPGPQSMMMRPTRTVAASAAYNAVVFTGEATTGPPIRGYAEDTDPTSVTYAARVGRRPYFASSPLIKTQQQADLAAATRLRNIIGIPDQVVVPVIPNHALELGDVIIVRDPDQGMDVSLIVDSFPLYLRAADGVQAITCRAGTSVRNPAPPPATRVGGSIATPVGGPLMTTLTLVTSTTLMSQG